MRLLALSLLCCSCLPFTDSGLYECTKPAAGCSADCWCPDFALNSGESLSAIWGASGKDVWAVGKLANQALHYDGTGWKRRDLPISGEELTSVWGSSEKDVWAAGDNGTLLHFDGAGWAKAQSPTLQGLNSIAGTSSTNVWAAGYFANDRKNLLRFDGTTWALQPEGPTGLFAVLPLSEADVWAGGITWGQVSRYDGTKWNTVVVAQARAVHGFFARAADDLWMAEELGLQHWDGTRFERKASSAQALNAVWASGAFDVWAVGAGGTVLRGDGEGFSARASGVTWDLRGVWGSGPGDVFAVGTGGVLRFHP